MFMEKQIYEVFQVNAHKLLKCIDLFLYSNYNIDLG